MWDACLNDFNCLMINHCLSFDCMYCCDAMNQMQVWFVWDCELRLMDP